MKDSRPADTPAKPLNGGCDTAVAVKSQHAYHRPLRWAPRTDREVQSSLTTILRGDTADPEARIAVGDCCLERVVHTATAYALPIKLHTGYQAGTGAMRPERLSDVALGDLFRAFPDTRFVLLHGEYPHFDAAALDFPAAAGSDQ